MTLPDYLNRAKETEGKATMGPWEADPGNCIITGYKIETIHGEMKSQLAELPLGKNGNSNATFIAESRQLVPTLIKIVELQERIIEMLKLSHPVSSDMLYAIRTEIEGLLK